MSYYSANNKFKYTLTNNTNYVIEQDDYDIILDSFNRWDSLVTVDSRHGSSYQITINIKIDYLAPNILGGAEISHINSDPTESYGNTVPYIGNITINNSKMYNLKTTIRNNGKSSLYYVLLHEIGHILGIGSFWSLPGCPKTGYVENGTTKHYYTGTNAFREYKSCFAYYNGSYNDSFVGIPIEDNGSPGTVEVHPEEGPEEGLSVDNRYINGIFHPGLDTELMTGWLDGSPVSTPLSKITLGFLEDMGYTVNYNLADVYIMSWPSTTDANNLEQTYIKGFLDVSGGNMINRNGNLSVLDGTMDVSGDVTFDSKLSVGGDVSLCSTGGVNARVDICGNLYAQYDTENPSIPADAIIGLGNVTPNFTGPVKFEDKVGINTTVIPDANSAALDVSGNINFSGILKKDGVEYVSGATDLNGLSDVISGGTDFANGLLIGSTTGELDVANNNTGVGKGVFAKLTSGDGNVGMGYMSLNAVTSGSSNICIGVGAARLVNTGQNNVAIGDYAGDTIKTGGYNTFIGSGADADTGLTNLSNSTAIGYNAIVTASNQIMLGTAGESVVIPGSQLNVAGKIVATGNIDFAGTLMKDGTAFGYIDITNSNYSFGKHSQYLSSISGTNNVGFGKEANKKVNAGSNNVGMGSQALHDNESGNRNTALGFQSLTNVTGDDNTAIGSSSGTINITGINNTYLGALADAATGLTELNNSTAIGANAKVTASNQIMLGTAAETVVAPGQVDICGNLYAHYPDESIPASAILGGVGGNNFTTDVSMNANLEVFEHITINPIDVAVDVKGIQALDEYVKFTIPYSMTALKYFCTSHSTMIGDFILASSPTETDKTYYVRMVATDPQNTAPYYLFSDTPNGTTLNGGALNDEALTTNGGIQLTLYKGNTYTFISTNTVGHPFIVGDSWNGTTGIKLESTGTGAATTSTYREPYPLHINGTANIEKNLNVAKKLTVSGPIIQW
jgi:hypothetical protein